MSAPKNEGWRRLEEVAERLSVTSRENRYDVYTIFDWPDALEQDRYWMSPELMTCYGTEAWDDLGEADRVRLSHVEAVHFFSLNVHLIRDLIGEVANRIYTSRYPGLSEYFHDFIAEENVHAWFFATFCQRYGGKVYQTRAVELGSPPESDVLRDISVFGRILIAEELCDYFNTNMANDTRLPALCQQINRVHHQDESRHIAFGRQIMRALRDEAVERVGVAALTDVGRYLARYISVCIRAFYNREAYADAGLPDAAGLRARLIRHPARIELHQQAVGRTVTFLDRIGMISRADVEW